MEKEYKKNFWKELIISFFTGIVIASICTPILYQSTFNTHNFFEVYVVIWLTSALASITRTLLPCYREYYRGKCEMVDELSKKIDDQ